jgi:hypothetical protein
VDKVVKWRKVDTSRGSYLESMNKRARVSHYHLLNIIQYLFCERLSRQILLIQKSVAKKVRQKNRGRKTALGKSWQKKCGRKIMIEESGQRNYGTITTTIESR